MKIRNGFVSNSSSSSFIVMWDKEPKSAQEIKEKLFGVAKTHEYYDYSAPTDVLAEKIFKETEKASENDIKEEISGQYMYYDEWYDKGYKADEKLCKQYEKEYLQAEKDEKIINQILKDKYNDSERNRILRKKKLERILDESTLDNYEKEYLELIDKLEEIRKITWFSSESGTMKKLIDDSYNKYMKDSEGKFVSIYKFSDNDGINDIILEHGDCFYKVEHTKTSHH